MDMTNAELKNYLIREGLYCYRRGWNEGIDQAKRLIVLSLTDQELARQVNEQIDRLVEAAKKYEIQPPVFLEGGKKH